MKPEPLTKDKIKNEVIKKNLDELNYIYENLIDRSWFTEEEKEGYFEDVRSIAHGLIESTLEEVGKRIEHLLKEIEKRIKEAEEETIRFKEYRNIRMFDFWDGKKEGLIEAKNLVKKAFKGVVEE